MGYIRNSWNLLTNYGERYRSNQVFTSSFIENSINTVVAKRFCKKQQMQWSKNGAHLLLIIRAKVLNNDLGECFKKWYPNTDYGVEDYQQAA